MNERKKRDNYPAAAVRHYKDGELLKKYYRTNNAMCHYAFASECAIKALYCAMRGDRAGRTTHDAAGLWGDLQQYCQILGIMNAKTGIIFSRKKIPERLFEDHPGRRYQSDAEYAESDMQEASEFSEMLIQEVISELLDGRIMPEVDEK